MVEQNTRREQQLGWLGELYPTLVRVAQAIISESGTVAEDLTSDAVVVILSAIREGRCTITVRARFVSYCKNMVRNKARNAFTRYHGDVRIDPAKATVFNKLRPDCRHTPPREVEENYHPYRRWETVEPTD